MVIFRAVSGRRTNNLAKYLLFFHWLCCLPRKIKALITKWKKNWELLCPSKWMGSYKQKLGVFEGQWYCSMDTKPYRLPSPFITKNDFEKMRQYFGTIDKDVGKNSWLMNQQQVNGRKRKKEVSNKWNLGIFIAHHSMDDVQKDQHGIWTRARWYCVAIGECYN